MLPAVAFHAAADDDAACTLPGDLRDVVPELFVGIACIAGASLGFHDAEHVATCVIQAIVGDAVPGLGVLPINRNF